MPSVTVQQMKRVDEIMVDDFSVGVLQMMENAGRLLARLAVTIYQPKMVTILVGPGNNGGGGLVAARYLHNYNIEVNVVNAGKTRSRAGERHLKTVKALDIPVSDNIEDEPDIFIDALLGYGAVGEPEGDTKRIIEQVLAMGTQVLSLDVPSGFDLTKGIFYDTSFNQTTVMTVGLPKTNMINNVHDLWIADIGIPVEVYERAGVVVLDIFKGQELIRIK